MFTGAISIILSTYNSERFLALSLEALTRQRGHGELEVVVADDGSGPATKGVVDSFRSRLRIVHAWHPDEGFRLSAIRNLAVARSAGSYLIFLDGDCLPRPGFVRRFRAFAIPGRITAGERVFLTREATTHLLCQGSVESVVERSLPFWLFGAGRRLVDRPSRLVDLGRIAPRGRQARNCTAVEGGNFGMARQDYEALDGFEEDLTGWGYEDWELAARAVNAGMHVHDGRFALGVFHLWHPVRDQSSANANLARYHQTVESNRVRANRGLASHAKPLPEVREITGA